MNANYPMLKRILDFLGALTLFLILSPIYLGLAVVIKLTSPGPVLHGSKRIGKDNQLFKMYKFRSMRTDTPDVATHLLKNPEQWVTPIGKFMRKTSLDELPQLLNILSGEMSFVGPRPALHNQFDLRDMRTKCGVHTLVPGLTGWAQINGRDEVSIPDKVKLDHFYLKHRSLALDLKIFFLTAFKVLGDQHVSH